MSKFENVLKAQKVRERRRTRTDDDDDLSPLCPAARGLGRGFFSFYPHSHGEENFGSSLLFRENDLIFVSLTLSLLSLFNSRRRAQTTTVLPAATQTRALERHDGYDLLGRDSVGDDRECDWNARHGVEGFSDRVEQETGLLKKKKHGNESKLYH
jgi:hypothetical protein